MSEEELIETLPDFDGWIIGDDPATSRVFEAAKSGNLKAAVKWGVGIDNVDFAACKRLNIPISNTPGMFGNEVADLALFYLIALARQTFSIDKGVKVGAWPKPPGVSLFGKTVALVGFGDIGRNAAKRFLASGLKVIAYDPFYRVTELDNPTQFAAWPDRIEEADFIVLTCALTAQNRHLINHKLLTQCKPGVRIVNVARGPLIDEAALYKSMVSNHVHSVALEVFEIEPLPSESPLRTLSDRCLFGSHNSSNTIDAVERTSLMAIDLLVDFLKSKI